MIRKYVLLSILDEIGPLKKELWFHPIVYHIQKQNNHLNTSFEFEESEYGPYSPELSDQISKLAKEGYISREKYTENVESDILEFGVTTYYKYSLTEKGRNAVRNLNSQTIFELKESKYNVNHLPTLIQQFSKEYPDMYTKDSLF